MSMPTMDCRHPEESQYYLAPKDGMQMYECNQCGMVYGVRE